MFISFDLLFQDFYKAAFIRNPVINIAGNVHNTGATVKKGYDPAALPDLSDAGQVTNISCTQGNKTCTHICTYAVSERRS